MNFEPEKGSHTAVQTAPHLLDMTFDAQIEKNQLVMYCRDVHWTLHNVIYIDIHSNTLDAT